MSGGPRTLIVVSGAPRSGTSLLMQMFAAAGLPIIEDGERPPDENNPKGYYEYQLSLVTALDSSWLVRELSAGKVVVKVIHRQLYDLPYDFDYKLIFVARDLSEVARSQNQMSQRLHGTSLNEQRLVEAYRAELEALASWLRGQRHFDVLTVQHHDLLTRAHGVAEQIRGHLDLALDTGAMASVVDPALYRQRRTRAEANDR